MSNTRKEKGSWASKRKSASTQHWKQSEASSAWPPQRLQARCRSFSCLFSQSFQLTSPSRLVYVCGLPFRVIRHFCSLFDHLFIYVVYYLCLSLTSCFLHIHSLILFLITNHFFIICFLFSSDMPGFHLSSGMHLFTWVIHSRIYIKCDKYAKRMEFIKWNNLDVLWQCHKSCLVLFISILML